MLVKKWVVTGFLVTSSGPEKIIQGVIFFLLRKTRWKSSLELVIGILALEAGKLWTKKTYYLYLIPWKLNPLIP